jgi:hypothetical protein
MFWLEPTNQPCKPSGKHQKNQRSKTSHHPHNATPNPANPPLSSPLPPQFSPHDCSTQTDWKASTTSVLLFNKSRRSHRTRVCWIWIRTLDWPHIVSFDLFCCHLLMRSSYRDLRMRYARSGQLICVCSASNDGHIEPAFVLPSAQFLKIHPFINFDLFCCHLLMRSSYRHLRMRYTRSVQLICMCSASNDGHIEPAFVLPSAQFLKIHPFINFDLFCCHLLIRSCCRYLRRRYANEHPTFV